METPFPTFAAERFTSFMEELCRILTRQARECFIDAPLLLLIWNRLMRLAKRYATIAERVRTGTLSIPEPAPSRDPSLPPAEPAGRRVLPGEKLPTYFGWLVKMIPDTYRFGADMCWLIQQLETKQLIFAAPQAARILRSACHMLGVEPPLAIRSPLPPPAPPEPIPTIEVPRPPWDPAPPEPDAAPLLHEHDATAPLATPAEQVSTRDDNDWVNPKNRC